MPPNANPGFIHIRLINRGMSPVSGNLALRCPVAMGKKGSSFLGSGTLSQKTKQQRGVSVFNRGMSLLWVRFLPGCRIQFEFEYDLNGHQ